MQVFKSAFVVSSLTIVSRISGFVRDIFIASNVGTGYYADIFFAAFKIANFLRKLLAEGTFFAAFVPTFSYVLRNSSKHDTVIFISKVFSVSFYVVIIITIIAEIFMPELTAFMTPGFKGSKLLETTGLSKVVFIYFFFIALTSILCSILNSIGRFVYYAAIPILMNVTMLVFMYFWGNHFQNIAWCLSYAVLAAGVLQFIIAFLACMKEGLAPKIMLPRKQIFAGEMRQTFKNILPSMVGGGLSQINTFVDLALGSLIVSGVSYLYYADRIFFLPTSVIGTSLGVIILPILSRQIASRENTEETIGKSIILACFFALPASAVLIAVPDAISSILFERGAFTHADTVVVGNIVRILGFALPFCIINKVFSSVFFGFSKPKIPMYISIISVIINVILSLILVRIIGIYGIIVGASSSYLISFLGGGILLKFVSGFRISQPLMILVAKMFISSAIIGIFLYFVCSIDGFAGATSFVKMGYFSMMGIVSLFFYVGTLMALRVNIFRILR